MPTPPTSGVMCGIGCNINVNSDGDLFVTKVIPGGPAAFSCEIAVGDVLVAVDGVPVKGDTPDEVARRIVGMEGMPITVTCRVRRLLDGVATDVDKPVTLMRQPAMQMPERLCEGPVGLGIDLAKLDTGHYQIRKLQSGGAAQVTGKLQVGDIVTAINKAKLASLPPRADISALLLGEPFSRVSVEVQRDGLCRSVHIVRSVVLLGDDDACPYAPALPLADASSAAVHQGAPRHACDLDAASAAYLGSRKQNRVAGIIIFCPRAYFGRAVAIRCVASKPRCEHFTRPLQASI